MSITVSTVTWVMGRLIPGSSMTRDGPDESSSEWAITIDSISLSLTVEKYDISNPYQEAQCKLYFSSKREV